MFNSQLTHAVEKFAFLLFALSEKDLERKWTWKDHDEEGIRFAFFVTLQELRQLAVTLSTLRSKPTPAQHILSQYHAAYMDLQAAILASRKRRCTSRTYRRRVVCAQYLQTYLWNRYWVHSTLSAMRWNVTEQAIGNLTKCWMKMPTVLST